MGSGSQVNLYPTVALPSGDRPSLEQPAAESEPTGFTPTVDLTGTLVMYEQLVQPLTDSFGNGDSVADELEGFFRLNFPDEDSGKERSPFQKAATAFTRPPTATARILPVTNYDALFSLIMQELVEMLAVKFGKLGCHHLNENGPTFYIQSLSEDTSMGPFEQCSPPNDPVQDMDDHQVLQMIDVWFSIHPLATIVSKTLFLREYRSNTHDKLLLAVVLADASYAQEVRTANPRAEALFQYASLGLHSRSIQDCSLSTAQTLTLIGWHELCFGRVRRATCFIGYAGKIMSKLKTSVDHAPATGLSQINGLDVGDVEAELINNAYWVTFAITLWAFLQADRSFSEFLPARVPTIFPPVDERSSAVAKLDVISHNVSTLQVGARRIRELWRLSHVASTSSHVYALLPRKKGVLDTRGPSYWQARSLHQLRALSSRHPDMSVLCVQIRRILADAAEQLLKTETQVSSSQCYVLTAYQTVIIHLLFPRSDTDNDEAVVTVKMLDFFGTSVKALLDIFARLHGDGRSTMLLDPRWCTTANIFTLELDACARALECFYARLQQSTGIEHQIIYSRRHELSNFAATLHSAAKSDKLSSAIRLRVVKKLLKKVRLQFEQLSVADVQSDGQETTNSGTPLLGTPALETPALSEPNYLSDITGASSLSDTDYLSYRPTAQNRNVDYHSQSFYPNTVLNSIEDSTPFTLQDIGSSAPGVAGISIPWEGASDFNDIGPLDFSFVKDWTQF